MRLPVLLAICVVVFLLVPAAAGAEKVGGPDPAVTEWPEWPHRVSCYGLSFDPVAAFSGRTNAERGSKPSERALRRFLSRGSLSWVRKKSWRLVVERNGFAEFASGRLAGELEWMYFRRHNGAWKWEGYTSDCDPSSLRRGIQAITWEVAEGQKLTPETTSIEVNLGPGECSGGRGQNDRVQKPEFREQQGKLLMTLWLRPLPPGGYTCVGLIEPPLKIELPEPLGDRELRDGGTYPPRFADAPVYG
jgi:hypothetical protein